MNFVLIVICIAAGVVLRKTHELPANSHKAINSWLINIAIPAIAIKYLPAIEWQEELILPLSMPVIIWFGSILFINFISKYFLPMSKNTKASLILVTGLSNTSFVGFPITQAFFGDKGLEIAVLCDQASFLVMAIFGVTFAIRSESKTDFSYQNLFLKLLKFPPFITAIIVLSTSHWIDFSIISVLTDSIAATVVPLALFSVGLQLVIKDWILDRKFISIGLLYKLIVAPAIIFSIVLLTSKGLAGQVTVLEAGMAPMVTGAILASDYNLNPKLANLLLGIGIPVSFLSVALWYFIVTM